MPGVLLVGGFKQQLVSGPSLPGSLVRRSLPVIFPMVPPPLQETGEGFLFGLLQNVQHDIERLKPLRGIRVIAGP